MNTAGDLFKTFTGLKPYWNYSIQIAAKTVELGNYSLPIFIMTEEGRKEYFYFVTFFVADYCNEAESVQNKSADVLNSVCLKSQKCIGLGI